MLDSAVVVLTFSITSKKKRKKNHDGLERPCCALSVAESMVSAELHLAHICTFIALMSRSVTEKTRTATDSWNVIWSCLKRCLLAYSQNWNVCKSFLLWVRYDHQVVGGTYKYRWGCLLTTDCYSGRKCFFRRWARIRTGIRSVARRR